MRPIGLHELVTAFFVNHLGAHRNVSPHTAASYRDALKLFLQYAASAQRTTVDHLSLEDFDQTLVLDFLSRLEQERGNVVRTRNQRLAALHSFFRYVMTRLPEHAERCQRLLAIPTKRTLKPTLSYLQADELQHLLAQVKTETPAGRRDYVLLALLYDTGSRVQELVDLRPLDLRVESPAFVRLTGKGRKQRICPLLPATVRLLLRYLKEQALSPDSPEPLFRNRHGEKLTRHGVRYLLTKYLRAARETMPRLARVRVSPHTLRHTKAMHLLQAGVAPVTIRDILGHVDVRTTEVYLSIDLEMKRKALESSDLQPSAKRLSWKPSEKLLTWLEAL
jgi:site-specific recombinase XerD